MNKPVYDKELLRQMFHLALGFLFIVILLKMGRNFLMAACFFALITGTMIINQLLLGKRMKFIDAFIENFERSNVLFPGWGSATYVSGVLILVTALESTPEIAAGILILAVGDSFSTIIGRHGSMKWPYNRKKSVEGTLAFFFTSLTAYFFIGPVIIPLALFISLIESMDWPLDDNIIITLCTCLVLLIV